MAKLLWSGIVMVLLVSGCGWNGTPTREDDISPITSITISADPDYNYSTIAKGTSIKLKATGHISGLGIRDLTDKVGWMSSDTTKADFKSKVKNRVTGLVAGISPISITATYTTPNGTLQSIPYELTVSAAKIKSITVTPDQPSVPNGLTRQFTATGTFDDGTTQNITLDAVWDSGTKTVAAFSTDEISNGLATAISSSGTSEITAAFNSGDGFVSGSTVMTATDPVVTSIAVTPANPSVLSLSTRQFKALGTYSDGSKDVDITSKVTWSSSEKGYATIAPSSGLATALTQGSASINASIVSNDVTVSGSTTLTVTGGNLNSIAITPSSPALVKDTKTRLTAIGTFTNGSKSISRDITGVVDWISDSAAGTLTSGSGNLEWLNAGTPGTATITATAPTGKTGTAALTVTAPVLSSLTISSSTLALTFDTVALAGTGGQLTATAAYTTSPSSADVTYSDGCSWSSDKESVATVGTVGLTKGRVTAVGSGTATITATFGTPPVSVTSLVTVTSRTLKSLTVFGESSVVAGDQKSYTAKAVYTDGSTEYDVTDKAIWSITPENVNVVVLADNTSQPGLLVAVGNGTATLSASFGGKTATKAITVP